MNSSVSDRRAREARRRSLRRRSILEVAPARRSGDGQGARPVRPRSRERAARPRRATRSHRSPHWCSRQHKRCTCRRRYSAACYRSACRRQPFAAGLTACWPRLRNDGDRFATRSLGGRRCAPRWRAHGPLLPTRQCCHGVPDHRRAWCSRQTPASESQVPKATSTMFSAVGSQPSV